MNCLNCLNVHFRIKVIGKHRALSREVTCNFRLFIEIVVSCEWHACGIWWSVVLTQTRLIKHYNRLPHNKQNNTVNQNHNTNKPFLDCMTLTSSQCLSPFNGLSRHMNYFVIGVGEYVDGLRDREGLMSKCQI